MRWAELAESITDLAGRAGVIADDFKVILAIDPDYHGDLEELDTVVIDVHTCTVRLCA